MTDIFPQEGLERQPNVVVPKNKIPEAEASNFALAVSAAMGQSGQAEHIKQVYQQSGRAQEWDNYKQLYQRAKSEKATDIIISNTVKSAEEMGLDQNSLGYTDSITELIRVEEARASGDLTGEIGVEALIKGSVASEQRSPVQRDADEAIYNDFVAAKVDQIVQGQLNYADEQEHIFLENASVMQEDWLKGDTGRSLAGGIAAELPLFFLTYGKFWGDMVSIAGGDPSLWEKVLVPGTMQKTLQKLILEMGPEERDQFRREIETYLENDWKATTDLRKMFAAQVVGPALGGRAPVDDALVGFENAFFLMLDAGTAANLAGRMAGSAQGALLRGRMSKPLSTGGGPAVRTLVQTSKTQGGKALTTIITDNADIVKRWGLVREDVVQTQLPKPPGLAALRPKGDHKGGSLEDVPAIQDDVERVNLLRERIFEVADASNRNILDEEARVAAVEREMGQIEATYQGKMRLGQSNIAMHEDGNGVRFSITLGKNDRVGFLSQRTAFEMVEELSGSGEGVRVFVSDGTSLKPFLTGKEALDDLSKIRAGTMPSKRGNFYVQFDKDYNFSPLDRLLFGDDVSLAPKWMGSVGRYLLTPSSTFGRKVYEPYLRNFLGEQTMTSLLDRIISPVFSLKNNKRRTIAEMYTWSNDIGMKERRIVTMDEIIQNFPDAGSDEYRGFYLTRQFYDTIYQLQNRRVRRDWENQGFRTLTHAYGKAEYHGAPVAQDATRGLFGQGGRLHAYDPETNGTKTYNIAEIDELYKRGGQILQSNLTIKGEESGQFHKLFVSDPKDINWRLERLSDTPLEYIPGYWPRMYEDYYFIEKVVPKAVVDGVPGKHTYVTHVAGTDKEASSLVRRLNNATVDGEEWRVKKADARLSEKDRTQMDLERLQVEGRLFFDDRNQERLFNVQGNPADIIDPINAIQRTARMVSRQVTTEDLVKGYKVSFQAQFGDLIPNMHHHTSAEIATLLKENVKLNSSARNVEAENTWNYIRAMEGSVHRGGSFFKRKAIQGAEFVAESLDGIPSARRPSVWLYRNAHRASPIEATKSLAFIDFLVTRPVRQLVLQGGQHLFIQALDPAYAGRWQLDTTLLTQGLRKTVVSESGGKKVAQQMVKRNAKLMGVTEQEYLKLIEEFDKSGLTQAIDVHSFGGETARRVDVTPQSKAGDVAQTAVGAATLRPLRTVARRQGFERGEGFNVAASWLMALRQYRKEHGNKAIGALTGDDWEAIKALGSNYGLAMVRPNASDFQYGILSLPLQFVQFSHKIFLTMLRGVPGAAPLGNKTFTVAQARKLIAGQMLLFGAGAGFGIKPEVESLLESSGMGHLIGTTASDILVGGIVDWFLDESLQAITGDEDLNLAFDEFLAPGANVINIARNMYEVAFETALFDGFLGPSENTFSRYLDGYRLARFAVTKPDWTPQQRAIRALDAIAAGAAAGYSDFFKARLAARQGVWMTKAGQRTEVEAKWAEIMAKGLLGLNTEARISQYEDITRSKEYKEQLDGVGREFAKVTMRAHAAWGEKKIPQASLESQILGQLALAEVGLDPEEYNYVVEVFADEMRRLSKTRESYTDIIAARMWEDGLPPLEHTKAQLDKPGMIPNEADRIKLKELIDLWTSQSEGEGNDRVEYLEELREEHVDGS